MEEVRRLESERHITVISMAKHGQWTTWESEEKRNTTPQNLKKWFREDPTSLCQEPASLRHILTEWTMILTQGHCTWQHNQVLRQLASVLEHRQTLAILVVQKRRQQLRWSHTTSQHHQTATCAFDWETPSGRNYRLCFFISILALASKIQSQINWLDSRTKHCIRIAIP